MQHPRTQFRTRVFIIPALLVLVTQAAPASAQAPPSGAGGGNVTIIDSPAELAKKLYHEGKAFLEKHDWEKAVRKFEEAYSYKKSYDIASNLGWTLSALDRHVEAARRLCQATDELPVDIDPDAERAFHNVYANARSMSGIARIATHEKGAVTILVDDQPVEVCIREGQRLIIVEPGEHSFVAERDGRRSALVKHELPPGEVQEVRLGPLQEPAALPPAKSDQDDRSTAVAASGTLLALGGVGAIVGAALMGTGASLEADGNALLDQIVARSGAASCPGGDPDCGRLRSRFEDSDTQWNSGLGLLIGGGVLAVAGAIGLGVALGGDDSPEEGGAASLRIVPQLSPDRIGISIHQSF